MKQTNSSRELAAEMIGREHDVAYIMACVAEADCCSIVGMSNIGKSTLLRSLALPEVRQEHLGPDADKHVFIYIDFNLVLQMTEQGFYEIVLRSARDTLETGHADAELMAIMDQNYQTVISPDSQFTGPLAFERSLDAVCRKVGVLVLLLDEFDEVFGEIEPRVFVRLRALKDKLGARLCCVTATGTPLVQIRRGRQAGEFCELFTAHTHHLVPLSETSVRKLIQDWAVESGVEFTAGDTDVLLEWAGGHPVLLQVTFRFLARAKEEASFGPTVVDHSRVRERLDSDANVRLECAKLWNDLNSNEKETLIALLSGEDISPTLDPLFEKGIVLVSAEGPRVFAGLFAGFARRQRLVRRGGPQGVRMDVEAGDIWVDGKLAPALTDLEYKLLLLLYGRLDKICGKYMIVESVWGESYIDEVDDARIEKLVSRLRHKIEPVPEEPRYLTTVRGRGYKLVSPE